MSETGFTCPKCGQTEEFEASPVVLYTVVSIDKHGWDYWTNGGNVDLHPSSIMTCCKCGYEDDWHEF